MKMFYVFLVTMFVVNSSMAQWIPQNSGTIHDLSSVYFTNPDAGYVVGDSGIILKTSDGGNQWTIVNSGTTKFLRSVKFSSSSVGYAVGDNGTILKTINGGGTWTAQNSGVSKELLSVHFPVEDTGYAVGGNNIDGAIILKTSDGGSNWINVNSDSTIHLNSVVFLDANTGYIGGNTNNWIPQGVVLKTTNGGINWTVCGGSGGWDGSTLTSMHFTDANNGYFGHNENNHGYISKTTDGGQNWSTNNCDMWPSSIYFPTSDTGFITGSDYIYGDGAISKTTDGGLTWTGNPIGTSNALNSIFFTDAKIGYAVGGSGLILKTTSGGSIGIIENASPAKLGKIYPNPVQNKIMIELYAINEGTHVTILNVNCRKIKELKMTDHKTQIDVSNLPAGVYFISIRNNKTVEVEKIIKE
jgi:photosystem II stability/assembly factor-like uncharacterized protein